VNGLTKLTSIGNLKVFNPGKRKMHLLGGKLDAGNKCTEN
jgi:hypothetical protein